MGKKSPSEKEERLLFFENKAKMCEIGEKRVVFLGGSVAFPSPMHNYTVEFSTHIGDERCNFQIKYSAAQELDPEDDSLGALISDIIAQYRDEIQRVDRLTLTPGRVQATRAGASGDLDPGLFGRIIGAHPRIDGVALQLSQVEVTHTDNTLLQLWNHDPATFADTRDQLLALPASSRVHLRKFADGLPPGRNLVFMRQLFNNNLARLAHCLDTFAANESAIPGPGPFPHRAYNAIVKYAQVSRTYRAQRHALPLAPAQTSSADMRDLLFLLRDARTADETKGYLEAELHTDEAGYLTFPDFGVGVDIRANMFHLVTEHTMRSYDLGSHLPGGGNNGGAQVVSFWPAHMNSNDVYHIAQEAATTYLGGLPAIDGVKKIPQAALGHPGIVVDCTHPDGGQYRVKMIIQGYKMVPRPVYHVTALYPLRGSGVIRARRADLNVVALQLPADLR